jgi:hypothetical protein
MQGFLLELVNHLRDRLAGQGDGTVSAEIDAAQASRFAGGS